MRRSRASARSYAPPKKLPRRRGDVLSGTETGPNSALTSPRHTPESLRSPAVTGLVPAVARIPGAHTHATTLIRQWTADHTPRIIEGRDIGTAVIPTARVELYRTTTPEIPAQRRTLQNGTAGDEQGLASIHSRHEADTSRSTAPLKPAHDAVITDTSTLTIDEVVRRVVATCRERGHAAT
ncbi:hypothetical protein CFP71_28295 [Amycolatopsis thailandensis]|uniref:(d)CMP kinase n=1 Tax=Amycolatopsis thailandensis TaxID=589330 RepID=A0A229RUG5_9PSEU|nr:(d)CMP kinase [Amycolatopsis thailandensis]OXM50333.1 hypothetical protein CFP71_28295 [Amycolatopsis thailandensis]